MTTHVMEPAARSTSTRTRTMRAAVITAPRTLTIKDVPIPEPRPSEIRVELEGCGVCASNLPPWEGRPWFNYPMNPGQLGHEAWGIIDAVGGDVSTFRVGERVAMLSDNAYAEYDVTQIDRAVHLPESLRDIPFPAEPLGCAMNIFRRCEIRPGDTVAIIGIGCMITDAFEGIETFFEPGVEMLVARSGDEVADQLRSLDESRAQQIGRAALKRVLAEHTYDHRAALFEEVLGVSRITGLQPVQMA
jgi:hypothetical protein